MDDRIAAPHVARLIGIKTPTLAKWRCLGKGPKGWIRVSPTHVTYPTQRGREVSRRTRGTHADALLIAEARRG